MKKMVISVVKVARILFVCVENTGRSQMAEAFLRRHAPHICAASAGTVPRSTVNPVVADAMGEVGIDIRGNTPKHLTQDMIDGSTVINMGCVDHDTCPALFAKNIMDWQIPDPKGRALEEVREIHDHIESKIRELADELGCEREQ